MTSEEQLDRWVAGESVHNDERDECCPDFPCCKVELLAPREEREKFVGASEDRMRRLRDPVLNPRHERPRRWDLRCRSVRLREHDRRLEAALPAVKVSGAADHYAQRTWDQAHKVRQFNHFRAKNAR